MTALGLARRSFLLFAFALFWMKDPLIVGGLPVYPADLLLALGALLWAVALLGRQTTLRWSAGFWPLLVYFAALGVSALLSGDPRTSAFKLLTQGYLLSIPLLAYQLLRSWSELRQAFAFTLAGAAITAAIGAGTVLLFPFFGYDSFLAWPLHHFGNLPPGPYPRVESTFEYPAMLANYLALALMLVLVSSRLDWMRPRIAIVLGGAIFVTALFALTPGFGGLLCMVGVWIWQRRRGTGFGRTMLVGSIAVAALEIVVAAVTPILHPTAPFLVALPGLPMPLAPAVRLLAWIDAGRNFMAHPVAGLGIGRDAVHVPYVNPSGAFGIVTDAHNMMLSLAAQAGVAGLTGMLFVVAYAARTAMRGRETSFGLALAFLTCLVIQGFVGAFEDARHIWLAYGLMLAAQALESGRVKEEGEVALER